MSKCVSESNPEVSDDVVLSYVANIANTSERGQGKKRKTHDDNRTQRRQQERRAQIERGEPGKLVEMPMDVLYEIFGQLEPLDLLHLACTTKALRSILTSCSSVFIWKTARSNIFGLPDCPDDLNELQYATLIFGTRCSFCQRSVSDVQICWYGRFRCCKKCIKLNFTLISPIGEWDMYQRYTRGYPTLLANWVPLVKVSRETDFDNTTGNSIRQDTFILKSTDKQWQDEYLALRGPKAQYEWLFSTLESRYAIQKHAHTCAVWHKARFSAKNEVMQQMFERDAQVTEFLDRLRPDVYKLPPTHSDGLDTIYDTAFSMMNWQGPGFVGLSPLNENILSISFSTQFKIFNYLTQREGLEYEEYFNLRKHILWEIYSNGIKTLPINSPSPNLAQTFHITKDHSLLDYSKPTDDALRVPFSEVVSLWRKHVDSKLIGLITNAYGSAYVLDSTTVFDLATTFFSCSCCRRFTLSHDQAMVHPCTQPIDYMLGSTPSSQRVFNQIFGFGAWADVDGSVEFHKADLEVMQWVVKMCGFDPTVTTAHQMDELDPIFECRNCNSFENGRATMSWKAVLGHQRQCHSGDYPEIQGMMRLEEPEASKVQERIKEEQIRAIYQQRCRIVCPHCRSVLDDLKLYREHLKDEHEISKFKYEDIIYPLQEDRIPPVYHLWPPLDEDSIASVS